MSQPERGPSLGEPQSPAEARASRLLRRLGDPPPFEHRQKQEVLRQIRGRLGLPASRSWPSLALGGLAAAAIAALLVSLWVHLPAPHPTAAPLEEVVASAGAEYQLDQEPESDGALRLVIRVGTVEVHPRNPRRVVAVHAPHLEARVQAESFWVQAAAEVTTLTVGEGQAWIGEVIHLRRGESIRSDDARLHPRPLPAKPAVAPAAPGGETLADCDRLISLNARRDCYLLLARGSDLAAQNALFELGMLQVDELEQGRAGIETFRAYRSRFPSGSLAPEAAYATLSELIAEDRVAEAKVEAQQFLQRFPNDGRTAEVRAQMQRLDQASAP